MRVLLIFSGLMFLIASNSSAQNSVFQVLPQDNGLLPYQQYVDAPFQFLINDDLQRVLTNPSRLGELNMKGIYSTINSTNNSRRFFYVSPEKWSLRGFFQYEESYTTSNDVSTSEDIENSLMGSLSQRRTFTSNRVIDRTYDRNEVNAELEFQRLLRSSENSGLAIGFRFSTWANRRDDIDLFRNDEVSLARVTENGVLLSENELIGEGIDSYNYDYDEQRFLLQMKASGYNRSWDWTQSINIQYGLNKYTSSAVNESESVSTITDENGAISRQFTDDRFRNINLEFDVNPFLLGYEATFRKTLDRFGSDYLIGSIQVNHAFGRVDLSRKYSDQFTRTDLLTSDIERSNTLSILAKLSDKRENFTDIRIASGYAIELSSNGLNFFTGFLPEFIYQKGRTHYYDSREGIGRESSTLISFETTLPVVAELELTRWVSIFGGSSLVSTFTHTDRDRSTIIEASSEESTFNFGNTADETNRDSRSVNSETDQFRLSESSFFGLKASHSSGVQLYADINGDLSRITNWSITVGYNF